VDGDLDYISPIGLDERSWELIVDKDNVFCVAIWSFGRPRYCKVIGACDASVGWQSRTGVRISPRCSIGMRLSSGQYWVVCNYGREFFIRRTPESEEASKRSSSHM
jgi:hypothetical protein